jgi:hypothetical protein
MTASDTELGTGTKADIIDTAVADAAFALKSGETSAPVKGRFGIALLQAGKIEPGEEKTYEQVAAQIKNEIAASRVRNEIGSLRDKIEDERAGGSTLAETAKKLGLKAITIERSTDPDADRMASRSRACRKRRMSSAPPLQVTWGSIPRRCRYQTAVISIST